MEWNLMEKFKKHLLIRSIRWINIKIFFSTTINNYVKIFTWHRFPISWKICSFSSGFRSIVPLCLSVLPDFMLSSNKIKIVTQANITQSKVAPLFAPKSFLSSLLHQRTLIHRPFAKSYIQCRYSLSEKKKKKTRNPKLRTSSQS